MKNIAFMQHYIIHSLVYEPKVPTGESQTHIVCYRVIFCIENPNKQEILSKTTSVTKILVLGSMEKSPKLQIISIWQLKMSSVWLTQALKYIHFFSSVLVPLS